MSPAIVTFGFDPLAHLPGDLVVRWSAIALAAVILAALVATGLRARAAGLRLDDVVFVAIGIVPGAVVGGRLGYVVIHPDAFAGNPARLLDPAVAGLDLGLAVVGGLLAGAYVTSLLGGSLGRWLSIATAPLLFGLGAGKLAMVLAGAGQGSPTNLPWATAYAGPGPWGSLLPALPSHPSQLYEGFAALGLLAVLSVVGFATRRRTDGRDFVVAIGLWALVRAAIAATWRDPVVAIGLGTAGLISLGIAAGCAVVLLAMTVRPATRGRPADEGVS